ncbi:glycosyltransferase [Chryseobacterium sp. PTM-20240506]|uniref:glycosyltransferase n=1 Tax=unclassified Chryseobacterium TaxID=2593645 RepID=UPI00235A2C27|nr:MULTISPECIES: glycosyltransferase [unclassified Chryseobacterium]MDC8105105.1 glycosyltransferase [Chryseobacterium sp. B21-037]MDQ1805362.1 glycosyltransferase [Chryseobacterium sp. CKR4-1]
MRILHVITLAELGGAQSVVINLAEQSIIKGHEVFVVSSVHGEMWDLLNKNIIQVKLKSLQHKIGLKDILVARDLMILYKKIKPDIIHLHSSKIGILGRLCFPKSKIIYTVHGFDSIRLRYRKFLSIERSLKKRCRAIVGVSEYDLKNLRNEGIKENIHLIQNGIKDYMALKKEHNNNDILSEIKNGVGKKIIISISRLAPPKRFDLFCEVAKNFLESDYVFVWIGNKESVAEVPKNVIMLGEKKEAHKYYQYADLALLLSDYEGLPISLIEALCYSKPIIASNVGGISELVDNNGKLVSNESLKEIINSITFILSNPNIYEKFAKKSRQIFEDKFTIEKMYDKYLDLYLHNTK